MIQRNLRRALLFFTTGLLFFSSSGQDLSFRRYSPVDGVAGEVVHNLLEDSYGFLWVATSNGISRFDGKNFRNYGYPEGLKNLVVVSLYEDKQHRLWAGTKKGIAELRGGRFITHVIEPQKACFVSSFSELDGIGLIACTDQGTYHLNDNSWSKINLLPEYKEDCSEAVQATNGYYLNYPGAIYFAKTGSEPLRIRYEVNPKNLAYRKQVSRFHGKVYAAINNRLFELTEGNLHLLIDSIPTDSYFNFTVDTGGVYWVNVAERGLFKYCTQNGKIKQAAVYHYDSHTAGCPYIDRQQNLWITSFEGLIRAQSKIFEDITLAKAAHLGKRINILPGEDNELIMSSAAGLSVLRSDQIIPLQKPASYKDVKSYHEDIVEGFSKDSRNHSWIITRQRKLFCWNGRKLLDFSHLMQNSPTDYIRDLTINPVNNSIFICDDTTLLCGYKNKFSPFRDRHGNIFSRTSAVLFTHAGIGLVNVYLKGLYFISSENEIIKAPPELDIIDNNDTPYFFEDNTGGIWVSNAGRGLVYFRIDEKNYSVKDLAVFTTEQGLPGNKIADMAFDLEGNVWLSCMNGMAVIKHNTTNPKVWSIYTIGKEQNIDLASPVTLVTDRKGNIWIASIDKLIKIKSRNLVLKKIKPVVVIEKVLLNMKETAWTESDEPLSGYLDVPVSPVIDYEQNTLGIQFLASSLYNADYFEYSYLLAPVDTSWSQPTAGNFISLVRLSAGSYHFKVRVRGIGTAWSDAAVFDFSIRPPFWDRWWFRLLFIIIASGTIISIYRNRIQKMQKKTDIQYQLRELEMKALKAQMNPHFIYNALNSIQALIADGKKMEAINYVGTFARLLRQVLEYAESNVISLDRELETLRLYIQLESLRLNMNLTYNIFVSPQVIAENEKVPPLILQPFVENALWHGLSRKEGSKILDIAVSQHADMIACVITDNGIGRVQAEALKKQTLSEWYPSKGIDITVKRLLGFNGNSRQPVIYHDLYDKTGEPCGTQVTVFISRNAS